MIPGDLAARLDAAWMARPAEPLDRPMSVYEVHLGSWRRRENGDFYDYRSLADELSEYAADLDDLDLGAVDVIRVQDNEFDVKHTLLADQVSKHLVYRYGDIPRGTANWLLDMEIAYGIFTADKASMLQQELGLSDPGLLPVIEQHQKFFAAKSRRQALERLLSDGDDATRLRAKMCQVLVKAPGNKLTDIVRELLVENAARKTDKFDELLTYDLDQFFWDGLGSIYKYQRTTPTIDDFVLWMFERAIEDFASTIPDEFRNIRSDFNSLRYDVRTQNAMTTLASRAADALDVKSRIEHGDYREGKEGIEAHARRHADRPIGDQRHDR